MHERDPSRRNDTGVGYADLENLLSFAVLAGLLTLLPGLDTAQIFRAVTIGGRSSGYTTLFGILGGVWVWGIAAALGISALLIA